MNDKNLLRSLHPQGQKCRELNQMLTMELKSQFIDSGLTEDYLNLPLFMKNLLKLFKDTIAI